MNRAHAMLAAALLAAAMLVGCATQRAVLRPVLVAGGEDTLYVYEGDALQASGAKASAPRRVLGLLTGGSVGVALGRPTDVDVDDEGRLYVSDGDLAQVVRMDGGGVDLGGLRQFRLPEFATPTGVEATPFGLAVADAGRGRVFLLGNSGLLQGELVPPGGWGRPGQMHWDGSRLFVCDAGRHLIQIFDGAGRHQRSFGGQGSAPGQFLHPVAVCGGPGGSVWVLDALNHRVQAFDSALVFDHAFGVYDSAPGGLMFPKGMAFDSEDHLYIADAAFNRVQVFSTGGALLYWFGEAGRDEGQFLLPSAICASGDRLFVADQYNRRVAVYRYLPANGPPAPTAKEEGQ